MRSYLAVLLIVAACGKGKDADEGGKGKAPAPSAGTATATAPVATPPPAPTPTPPAPPPPAPAVDTGRCNLLASGAFDAAAEVPRNNASVMTDYWFGDVEREAVKGQSGAAGAMVDALKLLTLNCQSPDVSISIMPGAGATTQSIPFGPKTYKLDKGKGDLAVLANVKGELLVNPSGTISITAFDGHRIAATIDLAGTTMDKRPLVLSGKLDYLCTGLSGCK